MGMSKGAALALVLSVGLLGAAWLVVAAWPGAEGRNRSPPRAAPDPAPVPVPEPEARVPQEAPAPAVRIEPQPAEDAEPAKKLAVRKRLVRYVRAPKTPADGTKTAQPEEGDWVDALITTLSQTKAPKAIPLAKRDGKAARRKEQLGRLEEREAVDLLDHVYAGLIWLALQQSPDGHFFDATSKPGKHNVIATTAFALMAFLDFRDQDLNEVFESNIAAAARWLQKRQRPDGSFHGGQQFYTTAIALMALGQAGASSGDEALRESVERGLDYLARQAGPYGGFRYGRGGDGDLSVTGWVMQAVEMARRAQVEIPPDLEPGLRRFLDRVWLGEHRFSYLPGNSERSSLNPVGMLMDILLIEERDPVVESSWRRWLTARPRKSPPLYSLYYGVRVALLLNRKLEDPWRRWVFELAAKQGRDGPSAGSFPDRRLCRWLSRGGPTLQSAVAVLTLEHALYLR